MLGGFVVLVGIAAGESVVVHMGGSLVHPFSDFVGYIRAKALRMLCPHTYTLSSTNIYRKLTGQRGKALEDEGGRSRPHLAISVRQARDLFKIKIRRRIRIRLLLVRAMCC